MKIIPILILCIFLFGCSSNNATPIVPDEPVSALSCTADSDCVPASCCHSTSCVPRNQAPDCTDVMCTLDCKEGTTDCGGGCYCDEGKCSTILYGPNNTFVKAKWR